MMVVHFTNLFTRGSNQEKNKTTHREASLLVPPPDIITVISSRSWTCSSHVRDEKLTAMCSTDIKRIITM
jgi:hypothetical protein